MALVKTDVSEESSASIIRLTRIGELRTTLAIISNRRMLRRKHFTPHEEHAVSEVLKLANRYLNYAGHTESNPKRSNAMYIVLDTDKTCIGSIRGLNLAVVRRSRAQLT
jgi:hypothetical protein